LCCLPQWGTKEESPPHLLLELIPFPPLEVECEEEEEEEVVVGAKALRARRTLGVLNVRMEEEVVGRRMGSKEEPCRHPWMRVKALGAVIQHHPLLFSLIPQTESDIHPRPPLSRSQATPTILDFWVGRAVLFQPQATIQCRLL